MLKRVGERVYDVQKQVDEQLQTERFTFQIDYTLQDNEALLMAYVSYFNGIKFNKEVLFVKKLNKSIKFETIFQLYVC